MMKLFLILILSSQPLIAHEWPTIIDASEIVKVNGKVNDYTLQIHGVDGRTLYTLDCHDFNYENDDYNFSGDFECRLSSEYSHERYSNLLAYNKAQTADWENRGLYYASHFASSCSEDGDWGRTRIFKLRGMTLKISISNEDIKNKNGIVEFGAFILSVSVENSPENKSDIYEVGGPPEWFHKPSMCVN